MNAGFARAQITPPVGTPMEGLNQQGVSCAIHDDLHVRVLYLRQDGFDVVIASFDLLFFERHVVDRFKGALGRSLGLAPSQIFLNTTHTHAGPRMTRWAYSGEPDPVYLDFLEEKLLATSIAAIAQLQPVSIWAGSTHSDLPVSRRKINADGRAEWLPNPQGAICDALPFCVLKTADGSILSILFSVACHPSMIYELIISAEFPGVAMSILNHHFKTEGSIFLQGCAGDTKPRHVADPIRGWKEGTWEEMEAAGREVANAVVVGMHGGLRRIEPQLKAFLTEARWPLADLPTHIELEAVRDNPALREGQRKWAIEMLHRLELCGLKRDIPISIHFLQFGPGLRFIGIEGEVLAKLAQRILAIYDQGVTFALGYTNGTQIYMPVTEEIPEGGYEVDSFWEYHHPAVPADGCERPLLEAITSARDSQIILNANE